MKAEEKEQGNVEKTVRIGNERKGSVLRCRNSETVYQRGE